MEAASQAADQVVRISLEGTEYVVRLTGKAAVRVAALLFAMAKLAKENHESKGAQRLGTMLKSGKELTVFSIPEQSLQEFSRETKRYGITYCALKDKTQTGGVIDLLVRAEDAPKISRIVERYGMVSVDATVEAEQRKEPNREPEQEPVKTPEEREGNPTTVREENQKQTPAPQEQHPGPDSTKKEPQSKIGSENSPEVERPSVVEKLAEIQRQQESLQKDRTISRFLQNRDPLGKGRMPKIKLKAKER